VFQTLGAIILKARSPNLSLDRGKNKSKFDSDLGTVGRVESVSGGLKYGCGGKKIFSSYYASISRKQYEVRPKSKGSRNCSKSYNKTISNRATLV